jgi:NADH-quinone oxidoreductase subunit L
MYATVIIFPIFSFFFAVLLSTLVGSRGVWFICFTSIFSSLLFSSESLFLLIKSNFLFSYTFSLLPYLSFFDLFDFSWFIKLDFLSIFIIFLICFISFFIQVFSSSYMKSDINFSRFIIFISFFAFSILLLVSGGNVLSLFVGWEIVGLASVLLINFWFNRQEAVWGAFKAFSVNRIGDCFIIFSITILFFYTNSLNFDVVSFFLVTSSDNPIIYLSFLFLLVGCFAKSAQFFFHSWLPDAMEGPTPVSALLHSATMVTAGVYLSLRIFDAVFAYPSFQIFISIAGVFTSFYSAFIITTVNNAKHTTAYTTLNQLGFMFYAVGSLCFSTALFHLFVHGFYKSFTFLENAVELSFFDDEQEGSLTFLNTIKFENFFDIFGFLVFISVNALPLSSPSVSKEVLVFSGFETVSSFISYFLLILLFIGFIDSCYDDHSVDYSSQSNFFSSYMPVVSAPFSMVFAYFSLGISAFIVIFFCEELFLQLSIFMCDFYYFSVHTEGSWFLFFPFFITLSFSFHFPLYSYFISSNYQFKNFLSNLFYYDTLIFFIFTKQVYSFFFSYYTIIDKGLLPKFIYFFSLFVQRIFSFFNFNSNFFSSLYLGSFFICFMILLFYV